MHPAHYLVDDTGITMMVFYPAELSLSGTMAS